MWSSRGPRFAGRGALLFAAALGGACKAPPDVTIHLSLESTESTLSLTVTDGLGGRPQDLTDVLSSAEGRTPEIGIYLNDGAGDVMLISFQQNQPTACHRLRVPLTALPLEFDLNLPALETTTPTVTGCDACMVEDCS